MKSLLKNPKSKCCEGDGGNGDSKPKTCLEEWDQELKTVCDRYTEEAATTQKDKEAYENSLGWEAKLTNWCNLIEETDEKVKAILVEINFLLAQIETVCVEAKCTYKVWEKLTCLVKTIFDSLYTYEKGNEGLKDKVLHLKELVKCLKDVKDEDKDKIIACIDKYEEKIKKICDCQEDVLSKLLETLKCATLLWAYICSDMGLEDKLESMRNTFSGKEDKGDDSKGEEDDCDSDDDSDDNGEPKYPCDDKEAKPLPKFPIKADNSTDSDPKGNDYYVNVKKDLKTAQDKTKSLKDAWIKSKEKSDETLSRKNSLKDAIAAAEALEKK